MTKKELLHKAQQALPGANWEEVSGESFDGYEVQLFSAEHDDYLGVYIMDDGKVESARGVINCPDGEDPFAWLRKELLQIKCKINELLTGDAHNEN